MITLATTANVHDGKIRDAFAWAVKASKYINEKFGTKMCRQDPAMKRNSDFAAGFSFCALFFSGQACQVSLLKKKFF